MVVLVVIGTYASMLKLCKKVTTHQLGFMHQIGPEINFLMHQIGLHINNITLGLDPRVIYIILSLPDILFRS